MPELRMIKEAMECLRVDRLQSRDFDILKCINDYCIPLRRSCYCAGSLTVTGRHRQTQANDHRLRKAICGHDANQCVGLKCIWGVSHTDVFAVGCSCNFTIQSSPKLNSTRRQDANSLRNWKRIFNSTRRLRRMRNGRRIFTHVY